MKTPTPPKPAVDELYQKIYSFVGRRVSQSEDQEDLVQEIFFKFNKNATGIRDKEKVIPWLYRTASNQIIDYYRKRKLPAGPSELLPELEKDPENEIEKEVASWLQFFIKSLKPSDQAILKLVELEGKTQKEAADILGITLSGAKSRHQRAKHRLKLQMEACCHYFFDGRGRITDFQKRFDSECCET